MHMMCSPLPRPGKEEYFAPSLLKSYSKPRRMQTTARLSGHCSAWSSGSKCISISVVPRGFGFDLEHTVPRQCQATALALIHLPGLPEANQVQEPLDRGKPHLAGGLAYTSNAPIGIEIAVMHQPVGPIGSLPPTMQRLATQIVHLLGQSLQDDT